MVTKKNINNVQVFEKELAWLTQVLNLRFQLYFNTEQKPKYQILQELKPPRHKKSDYSDLIKKYKFGFSERVALALCLATHLRPQMLDVFFTKNKTFDRNFTEFGGFISKNLNGFLPTGETLLFILAGSDIENRLAALQLFDGSHPLFKFRILELVQTEKNTPKQHGLLQLTKEYEVIFLHGMSYQPTFGINFPAKLITTELDWDNDLVLPNGVRNQLNEIKIWAEHGNDLLDKWNMRKKIRPGYRGLFFGPPGTGKTMTASLLGKETNRDVYRIDLSMVVSKYIGETEKNLSKVFSEAEDKNWILFFDEADAIFGKRTEVKDAHDRYANQEISYLLQRIETFSGISILASNLKGNLDDAFVRRFESVIYFPMPSAEERLKIWKQGLPTTKHVKLGKELNLNELAEKYELSGGGIMNAIRYASVQAIANGGVIKMREIMEGVKREFVKEGRLM